jgi:putative peptidoglycan lipid II flippase
MSQMLKSTGAIGLATFTSRLLGMAREIVYAAFMGDTAVAGIFKTALTIPNLFRRLLGEGALTAAFIPIFKEKEKTAGDEEMWKASNAVISGLILAASILVVVAMVGITVALFAGQPTRTAVRLGLVNQPWTLSASMFLLLELTRIMFPYMLLACLAAILMGMLNARGYFFIPALGSCIMNVVMIGSVFFLTPFFGTTLDTKIFAWPTEFRWPELLKQHFRCPHCSRRAGGRNGSPRSATMWSSGSCAR